MWLLATAIVSATESPLDDTDVEYLIRSLADLTATTDAMFPLLCSEETFAPLPLLNTNLPNAVIAQEKSSCW